MSEVGSAGAGRRVRDRLIRILASVALSFSSVVATLVLLELSLACFHPIGHSIDRNMYFEADPFTGYRIRPNSVGYYQNEIPARANSNGHRDDEATIEKPDGVFRILMLGDSFTVGANVRQEEAYPQVLERMLRRDCGVPIEVINSGVDGWEPFQYAQYYDHYGIRFRPDLVLVGFFVGNDAHSQESQVVGLPTAIHGRRIGRAAAKSEIAGVRVWLSERFHLARLAFAKSPATFPVRRKNCRSFPKFYLDVQRQRLPVHQGDWKTQQRRTRNSVAQMKRLKTIGLPDTRNVIVLLPDENQINPHLQRKLIAPGRRAEFNFRVPQRFLTLVFQRAGLATIDLLETFRRDRRCLYMNDTHWTAEGHELAAQEIARQLLPMLPCAEALERAPID